MIPLEQVSAVLVESQQCTITAALVTKIIEKNITMLFCDAAHNPCGTVAALGTNVAFPGRIMDQKEWPDEIKHNVWQQIVRNKINNQSALIRSKGLIVPDTMERYLEAILPGDPHNMEGQAARVYFNTLFTVDFNRRSDDPINAALNYGYSILLSLFNRIVSMHGYNMTLGIHHRSRTNPFNLSCDLMEPFRPMVDDVVFENGKRDLDTAYKWELVNVCYNRVRYNEKPMQLADAAEQYFLGTIKMLSRKMTHSYENEVTFDL